MNYLIHDQLEQIPRVPLFSSPSPVVQLNKLYPAQDVWLKDDSRLHSICGGNKIRRLEYLLCPFLQSKKELLTFGYEISNHVLATAYFCAQLKIPSHFIVHQGPAGMSVLDQERAFQKMERVRAIASSLSVVRSKSRIVILAVLKFLNHAGKIQIVPAGGSSPLGVLGSIRAAFELAHQVENGELPRPGVVYIPLGTGGTAVGLSIGFRALNWNMKVIAVKIAAEKLNAFGHLQTLAKNVRQFLPGLSPEMTDLSNLEVESRFLGTTYGSPLPESPILEKRWRELQGVRLESIYSGKAAIAFDASLTRKTGPSLFWMSHGDFLDSDSRACRQFY